MGLYKNDNSFIPQYSFELVSNTDELIKPNPRGVIYYSISESGCHEVLNRSLTKSGYILVWKDSKQQYLHRVAAHHFNGISSLHACHKCDNPKCFNPDHIFWGTDLDNMRDAKAKGRLRNGQDNHSSILTNKQAKEILLSNLTNTELSKQFNVHWVTIYDIKKRRTWKHLTI